MGRVQPNPSAGRLVVSGTCSYMAGDSFSMSQASDRLLCEERRTLILLLFCEGCAAGDGIERRDRRRNVAGARRLRERRC